VKGPTPVEIWRFYVDRPWQGRGLAGRMMAEACAGARARGGETAWLAVWERNPRAIGFYRKCGFAVVGRQPFVLGGDVQTDLVMARPLGA
jgi:ribosomal protein S18 acetylase RimI-like enzyme